MIALVNTSRMMNCQALPFFPFAAMSGCPVHGMTPQPVITSNHILPMLVAAGGLLLWLNSRAAQKKIDSLTLRMLALETRDIQTLCGASTRQDWLKAHPELKDWALSLRSVQQANALKAPPRPANATKQRLYDAAENDKLAEVVAALEEGFSPNVEEELHPKFGTSPLMEAAFHGRTAIVRVLIENNAAINTQSGFGWTALHYAGQANKVECAALLIAAGADREIKNGKGKTAIQRAQDQGKAEVEAVLK